MEIEKKPKRQKNPTVDGRKVCPVCGVEKDLSEFTANKPNYCKLCRCLKTQEYYKKNKEKVLEKKKIPNKLYRQSAAGKESQYKHQKKKRRINPQYRLAESLRANVRSAIFRQPGAKKVMKTMDFVGCSPQDLRSHLEQQFTEGMSWDNYGKDGWEVDHIKPVTKFNLIDPEEQKKCFHYTNLQPLWAIDNRIKSNKYNEDSQS